MEGSAPQKYLQKDPLKITTFFENRASYFFAYYKNNYRPLPRCHADPSSIACRPLNIDYGGKDTTKNEVDFGGNHCTSQYSQRERRMGACWSEKYVLSL